MKINYFVFYALCCIGVMILFGLLDALTGSHKTTATDCLIVGLGLAWAIDKEWQKTKAS